ncbi:MAG: threonine-phosphate decarboxylase [Candidatus Omnitrophota bacterium]|nr:MAG: threonine-phosphate decarboxylase [Candidatus Omnitrophota bacterium]
MANLNFLHGGNIHEARRRHGKEIIDFSANINPLGLPANVKASIYRNFDAALNYPDPDARDITREIAKYWNIKEENILVGNGSAELIYLIVSACRPKTVLMPAPSFSEYERAARGAGSKPGFLKLREKDGFKPDFPGAGNADILFICNPNNPTGNVIVDSCRDLIKLPNKFAVIDEAFMDFLPCEKEHTLIWEARKNKKIIVLRSFTKFFALPGLRIGYLVAHKDFVKFLRRHQIPWSINAFAQLAAKRILSNKVYIKKTRLLIERERSFLFDEISGIKGLTPYPSVTNFILIKITKPGVTSKSLKESLITKGILIRDCSNFRALNDKYIRVAVRSRKENLKLLKALKS